MKNKFSDTYTFSIVLGLIMIIFGLYGYYTHGGIAIEFSKPFMFYLQIWDKLLIAFVLFFALGLFLSFKHPRAGQTLSGLGFMTLLCPVLIPISEMPEIESFYKTSILLGSMFTLSIVSDVLSKLSLLAFHAFCKTTKNSS